MWFRVSHQDQNSQFSDAVYQGEKYDWELQENCSYTGRRLHTKVWILSAPALPWASHHKEGFQAKFGKNFFCIALTNFLFCIKKSESWQKQTKNLFPGYPLAPVFLPNHKPFYPMAKKKKKKKKEHGLADDTRLGGIGKQKQHTKNTYLPTLIIF